MILLFDIGNTNTHVGLANHRRIVRHTDLPTAGWVSGKTAAQLGRFVGKTAARGGGGLQCRAARDAARAAGGCGAVGIAHLGTDTQDAARRGD